MQSAAFLHAYVRKFPGIEIKTYGGLNMKKHLKKFLAMTLAMAFVLALAACGSPASTPSSPASAAPSSEPAAPETTEPQGGGDTAGWAGFEGWQSEDWDAKTIRYQFTGAWALEEYGMNFQLLINLYSDGSALVDQRNISSASSYTQYGYWSEEETQDGNEITLRWSSPIPGFR